MTDREDLFLILGRLEGKMDSYAAAQVAQVEKTSQLENKVNDLMIKVALISGIVGGGAGFAGAGILH